MIRLSHPAVLSAMAGMTDGIFCRKFAEMGCGLVTLGGINADRETQKAAQSLLKKGRQEFVFEDLTTWLKENIGEARKAGSPVLVNIRSATVEGYVHAATTIEKEGGWVEVNAHCRQAEMMEAGAGEALLFHLNKLEKILSTLRGKVTCPLFLKFRGNVCDEKKIVAIAEKNCDGIHVDAYKKGEQRLDLSVLQRISETRLFKIANNGITDVRNAEETYPYCDAFSFARLSLTPKKVRQLLSKTTYCLFAYGTLTNREKAEALVGHNVPMTDAILPDCMKKSLGGIYFAHRKKGEHIEGKLLRLELRDFIKLDKYEGVEFGMYERTCGDVLVEDKKAKAYVYIAGKKMRR